jgi:hypothetical protein
MKVSQTPHCTQGGSRRFVKGASPHAGPWACGCLEPARTVVNVRDDGHVPDVILQVHQLAQLIDGELDHLAG